MKRCLLGIYEKAFPEELSLFEMISASKKAGYDFFEISIDRTEKRINRLYDDALINKLVSFCTGVSFRIESIGLSALGTYTLGNENAEIRNKAKDIFVHAVAFAKRIGARIIQIPACDVPKFDARSKTTHILFLESLKEIVEIAAREGVLVGLENMENDYADTVDKCLRIVKEVNSPYLQLYTDSGNITSASKLYSIDPLEDLRKGVGRTIAFHLKETKPNKYGGLFYGEGHVDFPSIVNSALHLGVRRFVMEYWYTGNSNWESDLIKAKKMFEEWAGDIE